MGQQVDPKYVNLSTKTKTQTRASTEVVIGLDSPNTDNSNSSLQLGQQVDPKYMVHNFSTKTKTQSRAPIEVVIGLDSPNIDNSNSSLQLGKQMDCSGSDINLPRVKKASVRSQARAKHEPQELTQIKFNEYNQIAFLIWSVDLNEMQQFNQILRETSI